MGRPERPPRPRGVSSSITSSRSSSVSRSRRDFLKLASLAALAAGGRRTPLGTVLPGFDLYPHAGDPTLRELAARALEAARAGGATYADVRLTLTRIEDLRTSGSSLYFIIQNDELAAAGVRALVDGAWGFASSPLWTLDEMARLGREAAAQAKANARSCRRRIDLGDPPPAATGEWRTPIARDPFAVPLAEKIEVGWAYGEAASRSNIGARNAGVGSSMTMKWQRQEKTFASTEGAFLSQTLVQAHPELSVGVVTPKGRAGRTSDLLQPTAGGWEVVADAPITNEIPHLIEDALLMTEAERVTPNRYDVVFDARVTAQLVARTIGVAAELDRVLGYEANAGGTSYLAPPGQQLGSLALGPGFLNVRANRSSPRGLATVKWDDEGVSPEEYPLIQDGVLVDYHTTRELAGTLSSWYATRGRPVRSHGCAAAESAIQVTTLHPPNIEMLPGREALTFADLVAGLDRGLVVCAGRVTVDRQQLNGEVNGEMVYEVRNGKRTRFVHNAELLFRAPELWKSLQALGGPGTQRWTGATVSKGQPQQEWSFGVAAVPSRFPKVAVTDRMRKA